MSVTIRIPTVKYLTDVLDQFESIGQYSFDINVSIDRWSDELELDEQSDNNITRIHDLIAQGGESRQQMEQLRKHLRGE